MNGGFITIQLDALDQTGLSVAHYCVADMVYHLSVNPKAPVLGWCSMSRQTMADKLGVSKSTIKRILRDLETDGWVVKSPEHGFLKSGDLWIDVVQNRCGKKGSSPRGGQNEPL
jgi:hypothetical protein